MGGPATRSVRRPVGHNTLLLHGAEFAAECTGDSRPWILGDGNNVIPGEIGVGEDGIHGGKSGKNQTFDSCSVKKSPTNFRL